MSVAQPQARLPAAKSAASKRAAAQIQAQHDALDADDLARRLYQVLIDQRLETERMRRTTAWAEQTRRSMPQLGTARASAPDWRPAMENTARAQPHAFGHRHTSSTSYRHVPQEAAKSFARTATAAGMRDSRASGEMLERGSHVDLDNASPAEADRPTDNAEAPNPAVPSASGQDEPDRTDPHAGRVDWTQSDEKADRHRPLLGSLLRRAASVKAMRKGFTQTASLGLQDPTHNSSGTTTNPPQNKFLARLRRFS